MKLNRTGSNWNELERNKINENWDIIEGGYNDVVGQITDEVVGHLIDSAKLNWKEPVETEADLPKDAEVGETRMVRESVGGVSHVYRYNGEKWELIQEIDVSLVNEVDRRLTAQLAHTEQEVINLNDIKMDKNTTDIGFSQIDRNRGLLDETYLSDELKQQMAGDTPIHSTPADGSITLAKTAFVRPKKNLFNLDTAISGHTVSRTDGNLSPNSNYHASSFISIESGTYYTFSEIFTVAYYDAEKSFIRAYASPTRNESPENAVYMRVSMTNDNVGISQVEKGKIQTPYEPFKLIIENKYLEKPDLTTKDIPDIDLSKTTFSKTGGKNLFNKDGVVSGVLDASTGELTPNSNYATSDFIDVTPDTSYAFSAFFRLAWYDGDKSFISGILSPYINVSPSNAIFARVSVKNEDLNRAQMEKGSETSPYEPYKLVIDDKYINFPEMPSIPQTTNSDFEARRAIAERNAHDFVPNVIEPLNIPTYEGSGETTHPSVLYFPDGWNGYKFWMAHTPYPNSDNFYENPSIVASNDNITWFEPAPNPIAPLLPENTYQSDPCIFMNGDTMELWFRATTGTLTEIFRTTTTDGVNWTEREKLFDTDTFEMVRSQTVRMIEGKYCMWYTSGTTSDVTLKYAESTDGKNWTNVRELNIELDERYTWWHGDVIVENGKYEMVIQCQSDTEPWATFYTYSYDNENWTPAMLLIKPTENSLRFDNGHLYRPAMVMVDGEYYVYYSTPSKIALTKGKTIYSLGLEEENSYPKLFPVTTGRTDNNAYTSDDSYDKYPSETITYTKIFGQDGFPHHSGILKTVSVWVEPNNCRQYFYPNGSDNHYTRRAIADGWSSWKLVTAT